MAGLNQRGPFNEGPLTGNKQGICNAGNAFEKGAGYKGTKMGKERRCGIRRRAAWNVSGNQFQGQNVTASHQDNNSVLLERTRLLEEELKAIQQELSALK